MPESLQAEAWADHPLPIEDEATISQASLVARMTDWLEIGPDDRVLEIGTGSGYQTGILAELAAEVATVEFSSPLSRTARARLEDLGYSNVHFHNGDGAEGWSQHAPYDRILATVAFPEEPTTPLDQLSPGNGVALVPVGPPGGTQHLTRYRRSGNEVTAGWTPITVEKSRGGHVDDRRRAGDVIGSEQKQSDGDGSEVGTG